MGVLSERQLYNNIAVKVIQISTEYDIVLWYCVL